MNEFEIYEQAVKHYGNLNQIVKAMEECGELIRALARWLQGDPDVVNIAEEIADVEIMVEQIKIIFGKQFDVKHGEIFLGFKKSEKLNRLAERLAMERYNKGV